MTASEATGAKAANPKGDATKLLAWLKAELKATKDRKVRGLLLLEGARLLERAGRVGEAAKTLVTAANTDPGLLPAVWALIFIFIRRKSWKNIARLREAEQKAAKLPSERSAAFTSHGELLEDYLDEPEKALEAYEAAVEANPEDRLALVSIMRSAVVAGDVGRLANAVEKLADLTTDPRRRALCLIDLAGLQESLPEGSSERAIELLREAAAVEDGQWHWLGALERFALREDVPDAAADAVEGRAAIMAGFASMETAADAARFGAPGVADPAEAALMAAALYRQAAGLRERLGDDEAALGCLHAAAVLLPGDVLVSGDLVRLLERGGQHSAARAFIEAMLERTDPDGDEATLLRLALADLCVRAGDVDGAAEHYRAILSADPTCLEAVVGVEALLDGAERWGDLAATYEEVATALGERDESLSGVLLVRAAEIHDRHLDGAERAAELLGRVTTSGVVGTLARHAQLSILARLEKWRELASVLEELIDLADGDPSATGLFAELAAVQLGRLNEPVLALSTYARLLARDPEASWALDLMAELHAGLEQWEELAALNKKIAEATDSDEHAAASLAVAGFVLHTRDGDPREAEACYRASLERRPEGALAAAGLEELVRSGSDDGGLRTLLRERAEAATSEAEAERAMLALGLDHERVGEFEEAAKVYVEILDRDSASRGARWGLIRCQRRLGRWEELADALDGEVDAIDGDADRAGVLLELAEIFVDRIGRPAMAEDALRRAREADPELLPAVLQLLDMARANASWEEVDQLLQDLLALAPEAALLVAEERLALLAGPGRDDDSANVICDVLLENMPEHPGALLTKALVAGALRDTEARVESIRDLAKLEGSGAAASALNAHAALVAQVAGVGGAEVVLSASAEPSPSTVISVADSQAVPPGRAPEIYEARGALCSDEQMRVPWDLEVADALITEGDLEGALTAFRRVLAVAPASVPALEGIRHVAAALEAWEVRAEATERLAALYSDAKSAAALWASSALTWDVEVGDAERAEAAARWAVTLDAERGDAFARLLVLLGRKGDREGQAALLEERLGGVDEPVELVALLMTQASLQLEMGNTEVAAGCLETALLVHPSNAEALRTRSSLYIVGEQWDAAVAALMGEATHAQGSAKREALWRASEVLDSKLGSPGRAIQPLRILADEGDPEPETYRRILELARKARAWPDAARALTVLADTTKELDDHIAALRAEGRIRAALAADPVGARRAWQRVADLRPNDLEAIDALAELAEGAERVEVLRGLGSKLHSTLKEDPTAVPGLRALARVYRHAGSSDGLHSALMVLDALGEADQEELEELRGLDGEALREPGGSIGGDVLDRLRHPGLRGPAEELQAVVGPVLHKIYAADVGALGLGKPLRARGGDLLVERLNAAAEVFGVDKLVIRPGGADPFGLFPVPAPEITIGVGSQVTGAIGPTQRFLFGRALWHGMTKTAALADRTDEQVRALQDAATMEGAKGFSPAEMRLGVEGLQKEVRRHVPRKARHALAEAAQLAANASEEAMVRWYHSSRMSADRAGLLLGADIRAALPVVVPGWHGADPAERAVSAERVRESWAARALIGFAISEDYLALRAEIGLATMGS